MTEAPRPSDKKIGRLYDAMRHSYKQMERNRAAAKATKEQYLGHHYVGDPIAEVVINKIRQMVTIYHRLMASSCPQVRAEPRSPKLRQQAWGLETYTNNLLREMDFETVHSRAVLNSFFGVGIYHTGLLAGRPVEYMGKTYDVGSPFCEDIALDNFVIDTSARRPFECDFIGHRYARPKEWVAKKYPNHPGLADAADDSSELKAAERPSGASEKSQVQFEENIHFWKLYLPRYNSIVILADSDPTDPLEIRPYQGPEGGPYDLLGLDLSTDDVLPLGPAVDILELHRWVNTIARKLGHQIAAQRSNPVFEDETDMDNLNRAGDGVPVKVRNKDRIGLFTQGGPNAEIMGAMIRVEQIFDLQGGNISGIGGLAAQSPTATQDRMLMQSASAVLNYWRRAVRKATLDVARKIAWWGYHDPYTTVPLIKRVRNEMFEVPYTPEQREADFFQYNFSLHATSLNEESNFEKLERLLALAERWLVPTAQMAMQSGWAPNWEAISREIAKLSDMMFSDLYVAVDPAQQLANQEDTIGKPPQTKRTYERVSRPGTNKRGNEFGLMQTLAGSKPQNAVSGVASIS